MKRILAALAICSLATVAVPAAPPGAWTSFSCQASSPAVVTTVGRVGCAKTVCAGTCAYRVQLTAAARGTGVVSASVVAGFTARSCTSVSFCSVTMEIASTSPAPGIVACATGDTTAAVLVSLTCSGLVTF